MTEQFSRTELLYGEKAIEKLAAAKIAVFGLGGVGGYVVEALARAGVGRLNLIDNDKVVLSNINRQIYALFETIGRYKTDIAKERIGQINPDCIVNTRNVFYMPELSTMFDFQQYDYIVDAIDTVTAKIDLVLQAQKNDVKIISAMGAGNKTNPLLFEVADIYDTSVCPLAKVIRKELKKHEVKKLKVVYSKEKPAVPGEKSTQKSSAVSNDSGVKEAEQNRRVPASNSFVPGIVGLIIAGEIINEIINK